MRRLQTDYIDLYYVHYDDQVTPPEVTLAVFERLIKEGKIRAIGASNYSPTRLSAALEVSKVFGLPRFSCFQTLYNMYDREPFEAELAALCIKHNLPVATYFSLASGFLTGKYRSEGDFAKSTTRGNDIKPYLTPRGFRILDAVDQIAARYQATAAQISLAWVMARPGVAAAVSSATSIAQLDDMIAATRIQLDAESIAELNTASAYSGDAA